MTDVYLVFDHLDHWYSRISSRLCPVNSDLAVFLFIHEFVLGSRSSGYHCSDLCVDLFPLAPRKMVLNVQLDALWL